MRAFILAPFILVAGGTASFAQNATDMVFAPDAPCFSRSYDTDHLAAHPEQQVVMMVVRADTEDMGHDTTDQLLVLVDVMVRGNPTPYSGIGICIPGRRGLFCNMEGDAGGFTLEQQNGRLRLDVREQGMSFEGAKDFLTLEATRGDDRSFLLDEGQCG